MPTILRVAGYRFSFFAEEGNEPPHVHIRKAEGTAKFWLTPVSLVYDRGFTPRQLRFIKKTIIANHEHLLDEWTRFFGTLRG
jgi:hypothetical protein